jgi:hypothetical protein
MLIHILPTLLLRQDPQPYRGTFTQAVNRRCSQFRRGEWQHLYHAALQEQELHNNLAQHRTSKSTTNKQQRIALEQARNLNYSRAMNILRSLAPSTDEPAVILNNLNSLHPADSAPLQQFDPQFTVPLEAFSFINGKRLDTQIRRSKRGTAVDQWSWDSREMWRDILNDRSFLEDVAKYWIFQIAAGYLPAKYRVHLAGGRLTALSKAPKPGIRPINVPDVWRRLAANGLLTHCLTELDQFFQLGHPRVPICRRLPKRSFQNVPFDKQHCNSSLSLQQQDDNDTPVIANLDLSNAFNAESRQLIYNFATGCRSHIPTNNRNQSWQDILWRHFHQ